VLIQLAEQQERQFHSWFCFVYNACVAKINKDLELFTFYMKFN